MKSKKDLKREISELLNDKFDTAIETLQAQRDQDFEELIALRETVELAEADRAAIQGTIGDLNTAKASDLAEHNRLTQKLAWLDKQIRKKKNHVADLMGKLTELEVNPKTLNLLLTYHETERDKNEKG